MEHNLLSVTFYFLGFTFQFCIEYVHFYMCLLCALSLYLMLFELLHKIVTVTVKLMPVTNSILSFNNSTFFYL